jgi:hypothetical protein
MTLTRRAQQVWRARGSWDVAATLAFGSVPSGVEAGGSSHSRIGTEVWRSEYNRKALTLTSHDDEPRTEVYPWRDLIAHGESLTPPLRTALVALRSASSAHQTAYPAFAASKAAQGCGRVIPYKPMTEAQALYADEWDRYVEHRFKPWQQTRRSLDELEGALLDLALPLASDNTPADFLELMESMS